MTEVLSKYRESLRMLVVDLIAVLLAWWGFYREGFGCDTIFHMSFPEMSVDTWLTNGRYGAWLVSHALLVRGWSATDHYKIVFLFFLVLLVASLFLIQRAFRNLFAGSETLLYGMVTATLLIFVNVLFAECFMFTECFLVFPVSFFLAAAGFCAFAAGCEGKSRRTAGAWYIVSLILVILASTFYQIGCVLYLLLLAAYLVLWDKGEFSILLVVKEVLLAVGVFAVIAANWLSSQLFVAMGLIPNNPKVLSSAGLIDKLGRVLHELKTFFESSLNLLPGAYLPLLMFLLPLSIVIFAAIQDKRPGRIAVYLLLQAEIYVCCMAVPWIGGVYVPRMVFTLYTGQAVSFLVALQCAQGLLRETARTAVLLYLAVQIIFCNVICTNHYLSNQLDMTYTRQVVQKILDYEEETGITVEQVVIGWDEHIEFYYDEVRYTRDQINEKAIASTPYSALLRAAREKGRYFEHIWGIPEYDAIINEMSRGKNWDTFDLDAQVYIEGNIAYWVVF